MSDEINKISELNEEETDALADTAEEAVEKAAEEISEAAEAAENAADEAVEDAAEAAFEEAEDAVEDTAEAAFEEAEEAVDDIKIDAENPRLEENDNWQFDAEAHTLKDTLIQGNELEIEIPERTVSYETRERPKAAAEAKADEAPKKAKGDGRNKALFIFVGILTALIIGALVFFGIRYYTVPSKIGASETHEVTNPGNVALSVGDVKVSSGMYSYYYNQILSSYFSQAQQGSLELDYSKPLSEQKTTDDDGNEITWDKKVHDETETWLQQLVAYYSKGIDEKITVDADTQKEIDEQIESIKESAKTADQTVDEYVEATYGDFVTLATLRNANEWYSIASQYARKLAIEIQPNEKEVNKYFEEHKDEFSQIKFSWLPIPYSEDNYEETAKTAEEYAGTIKTTDDMKKAIPVACKFIIDEYVEAGYYASAEQCAEEIAATVETSVTVGDTSMLTQEMLDWLFSEETPVGSCKAFNLESYQAMVVLLKTEEPSLLDDTVYSVRHILIMPETDEAESDENAEGEEEEEAEDAEPTEEQWKAAESKANSILAEYEKGAKTEYSFALLAEKYTEDTASVSSGGQGGFGGLYQNVSLGQMVPEFENWATDENRKYGDTEIVKSQYGYHIMYFVDAGPEYLADSKLQASIAEEEKFVQSYPIKKNKRIIDKVSALVEASVKKLVEQSASQQSSYDDSDKDDGLVIDEDSLEDGEDIVIDEDSLEDGEIIEEDFADEDSDVIEGD